jgi:hypothetical protein
MSSQNHILKLHRMKSPSKNVGVIMYVFLEKLTPHEIDMLIC